MPVKRKAKRRTPRRATPSKRVRFPVDDTDQPVEADASYWIIHVLHWHALLVAIVAILVVGITFF